VTTPGGAATERTKYDGDGPLSAEIEFFLGEICMMDTVKVWICVQHTTKTDFIPSTL